MRALAALSVAGAVALTGCGGGDTKALKALRADPLAQYAPAGGRALPGVAREESGGGLFGKPNGANLERLYAVDASTAEAAFDAAVGAARDAGWSVGTRSPASTGDAVALLGRTLADGARAEATITLLRGTAGLPDGARPPVLSVRLTRSRG